MDKKEIKHSCPKDQTFSDKLGKCVNPNLENETVDDDSSSRNKSASNLVFPKVTKISGTSEQMDMDSNIDVTVQQSNADKLQDKVQQVNKRAPQSVDDRNVVGIKTKPFKRQDFGEHGI